MKSNGLVKLISFIWVGLLPILVGYFLVKNQIQRQIIDRITYDNGTLTHRISQLEINYAILKKTYEKLEQDTKNKTPRYLREGWERTKAKITYYCWKEPREKRWAGKTAFNKSAKNNTGCAVDPRIIPYGSEICVEILGRYYLADDTGGLIKKDGNKGIIHIDVRCLTIEEINKYKKLPQWQWVWIKRYISSSGNNLN